MSKRARTNYSAFDTAVYYLSFCDRSKKELIDKLKEKGYQDSEIDEALDKLIDYGYLSDERYALSYIKGHIQSRGSRRIALELSGKGVPADMTRMLLSELEIDEEESVRQLLKRRYADIDFEDEAQVRRMYAFFARRGFCYEDIRRAVSKYRKNIEKI